MCGKIWADADRRIIQNCLHGRGVSAPIHLFGSGCAGLGEAALGARCGGRVRAQGRVGLKRYCRIDNGCARDRRRSRLSQEGLGQHTSLCKAGEDGCVVRRIAALDLPACPFDITDARVTFLAPVLVQPAEVGGEVDANHERAAGSHGRGNLVRYLRPSSLIREQHDEASHRSLRIDDMHVAEVALSKAIAG